MSTRTFSGYGGLRNPKRTVSTQEGSTAPSISSQGKHLFSPPKMNGLTRKGRSVIEIYKDYYSKGFINKEEKKGPSPKAKSPAILVKEMLVEILEPEEKIDSGGRNSLRASQVYSPQPEGRNSLFYFPLGRDEAAGFKQVNHKSKKTGGDSFVFQRHSLWEQEESLLKGGNNKIPDVIFQEYLALDRREALLSNKTIEQIQKKRGNFDLMKKKLNDALKNRREEAGTEALDDNQSGEKKVRTNLYERKHVERIKSASSPKVTRNAWIIKNKVKKPQPAILFSPLHSEMVSPSKSMFESISWSIQPVTPAKLCSPHKSKGELLDDSDDPNQMFRSTYQSGNKDNIKFFRASFKYTPRVKMKLNFKSIARNSIIF